MTLAFKWYYRYRGEGSVEHDQFIELFKCSFGIYSSLSCWRVFPVLCQTRGEVYSTEVLLCAAAEQQCMRRSPKPAGDLLGVVFLTCIPHAPQPFLRWEIPA